VRNEIVDLAAGGTLHDLSAAKPARIELLLPVGLTLPVNGLTFSRVE
jgi:hypothetical protein